MISKILINIKTLKTLNFIVATKTSFHFSIPASWNINEHEEKKEDYIAGENSEKWHNIY